MRALSTAALIALATLLTGCASPAFVGGRVLSVHPVRSAAPAMVAGRGSAEMATSARWAKVALDQPLTTGESEVWAVVPSTRPVGAGDKVKMEATAIYAHAGSASRGHCTAAILASMHPSAIRYDILTEDGLPTLRTADLRSTAN